MSAPEDMGSERRVAKMVVVVVDLAGFTKAFHSMDDEAIAAFLDEYYALCVEAFGAAEGRVVKFMGDGCLAIVPPERAADVVRVVERIETDVLDLARRRSIPVRLGANLHLAKVVCGPVGRGDGRSFDVIGRGVNQTFLLGRGPGIRISEPLYRQLPSDARAPWRKHKPPAIYHLESAGDVLGGMGKDAATNAGRW